jgi:GNAT superfamily N-acetyltransferase
MAIVIRQATMSDAAPIWAVRYAVLENTLTPGRLNDEDLRREIEDTGRGWVVEEEGSIRAFAIGNARTGNVWALFVHPDSQGRGYGHRLHEVMVGWLGEQGSPTPWLTTGQHTKATAFYERRGWRRVGVSSNGEARYELPEAT